MKGLEQAVNIKSWQADQCASLLSSFTGKPLLWYSTLISGAVI